MQQTHPYAGEQKQGRHKVQTKGKEEMTLSRSGKGDQWRDLTKTEGREECLQKSRPAPSFEGEENHSGPRAFFDGLFGTLFLII